MILLGTVAFRCCLVWDRYRISAECTHVEQVLFTGRVLQILVRIKCEKQRIFSMFSTVVKNSNMSFCHKNFNKLNAYHREK